LVMGEGKKSRSQEQSTTRGHQLVLELDKQGAREGVHNGLRLLSMELFLGHLMLM
jgi:hypothetical protein